MQLAYASIHDQRQKNCQVQTPKLAAADSLLSIQNGIRRLTFLKADIIDICLHAQELQRDARPSAGGEAIAHMQ